MVYTVTLNPALDYTLKVSEVKKDVQTADKCTLSYGGKGINVSVILSNLGIKNTALGFIGGLSGEKLRQLVEEERINTDFIKIDGDTRINVKITGAKNLIVNAKGPSVTLKDEQLLLKKLSQVKDGDYVVLSGSVPASMGENSYDRILDSLKNKKINIVVDTTGKSLKNTLKYKPFMIKPNNYELEEFFSKSLKNKNDIINAAKELQNYGAKNVLVSLGKNGMILVDENGEINKEPIIDGEVKNTTGCGDSAVAGFIAGYIKNNNFRYALKLANVCANATAFSDKLASKAEITGLLNLME